VEVWVEDHCRISWVTVPASERILEVVENAVFHLDKTFSQGPFCCHKTGILSIALLVNCALRCWLRLVNADFTAILANPCFQPTSNSPWCNHGIRSSLYP
jgi:hypothetical protein